MGIVTRLGLHQIKNSIDGGIPMIKTASVAPNHSGRAYDGSESADKGIDNLGRAGLPVEVDALVVAG